MNIPSEIGVIIQMTRSYAFYFLIYLVVGIDDFSQVTTQNDATFLVSSENSLFDLYKRTHIVINFIMSACCLIENSK